MIRLPSRCRERASARAWLALAVLLAAIWLALAGAQGRAQSGAMLVRVDEVRAEPFVETTPVIARIVAMHNGAISAQVAGAVTRLAVEVGDHVRHGQIIAELDHRHKIAELAVIAAQMDQARADLAAARADLVLAQQELDRQQRLRKTGAFARSRFDTARQQVAKAQARIASDEAVIATRKAQGELIRLDIDKARIRAPYDGVVTERLAEVGKYVKVGEAIARVQSDRALEIEADVPGELVGGLTRGVDVRARLAGGPAFTAVVRAVLPVENPLTRTRPVRFTPHWDKMPAGIADAQSVTLDIPAGKPRRVVTVHKDAIVTRAGTAMVYVVTAGKAEARRVRLGQPSGSRIEVLAGLKVGDLAVVRGNERLQPGAAVTVKSGS